MPGHAAWIDKAGHGILEAFGWATERAIEPVVWALGKETALFDGHQMGYVPPADVEAIAAFLEGVPVTEFEALAARNEFDNDVEYLTDFYPVLVAFYRDAARRNAAVFVTWPG